MSESLSRRFAMTGVGGFVAPRHLEAIQRTGNVLVAACDPFDSVGILDRYFLNASFFKEFERFDRHLEKLRRRGEGIHYLSVCSPNYLHDAHLRLALRLGADSICEKPLVLSPWNLDALADLETETGRRVYNILQLRLHPAVQELRRQRLGATRRCSVDLSYVTTRGRWYFVSWKGNEEQSGGVITNIGIHFFDLLMWVFGAPRSSRLFLNQRDKAAGHLELADADVRWYLSLDPGDLPPGSVERGEMTHRSLRIEDQEFEFSSGFADLHTAAYAAVLVGDGFGIDDVRPSIALVHGLRHARIETPGAGQAHPLLERLGG
jgi:UDP-N-acetyl-2-amino-2-deoxyglucuronate dehydrogenase